LLRRRYGRDHDDSKAELGNCRVLVETSEHSGAGRNFLQTTTST
jgi:hypothetical protein